MIRELVAFSGVTVTQVARKAKIDPETLRKPIRGLTDNRLSQRTIEKLRSAYPNFPGWADDTGAPMLAGLDQMVEVAEIDLRFGLGAAFMDEEVTEQTVEMRSFPLAWLRQVTTSPPSQLYWAKGQGDSMEPKISEGDIILIDRSQISASFGDLYWAIAYGQTGMIKRLRPMPDGSVKILSDNPNVPPETAYDDELHIFGRVVAVVKRI